MQCYVYKGARAPDTYLYLAEDDPDSAPEALRQRLGELTKTLEFNLHLGRKLARADASTVLEALESQGYFLQLPPQREALMGNDRLPR